MVMESMFQLSSGYIYGLVRFHKLGDLLSWEFFKPYSAEGDTIAMYKQNGYFTSVWLPWLHRSEGTVVKQFVQWGVTTTRAHIILPQQNWNTCEGVPTTVYQSCSNYDENISVMAVQKRKSYTYCRILMYLNLVAQTEFLAEC